MHLLFTGAYRGLLHFGVVSIYSGKSEAGYQGFHIFASIRT